MINIIVKPQARLTKRKTQIITNSNKTYHITAVPTDFKKDNKGMLGNISASINAAD